MLPLMPEAWRLTKVPAAEFVVSSSHAFCKSIDTGNATHMERRAMAMRLNISNPRTIEWHKPIYVPGAFANVDRTWFLLPPFSLHCVPEQRCLYNLFLVGENAADCNAG